MRLLLDTHIFLWWDQQLRRVPRKIRTAIEDPGNQIFVSAASVWEIAIKRAAGKLAAAGAVVESVERLGFELLPITGVHAEYAGSLPRHHSDPFDRMLVAQAIRERLVLGTHDKAIGRYEVSVTGLD